MLCLADRRCSQLCTADLRDHLKTAVPGSRPLRGFGVQITLHLERRELARAHIHAFCDRKQVLVRQGKLHLGMASRVRRGTGLKRQPESRSPEHAGGARGACDC